jgi:hypothetical protein
MLVKGVGLGHSLWPLQACALEDEAGKEETWGLVLRDL